MFIGGKTDWGVYQTPGAFESMQKVACTWLTAPVIGCSRNNRKQRPDFCYSFCEIGTR